jgi:SAM-dependent methyltransferase
MILKTNTLDIKNDTYWENIARSKWGSYITGVEKEVLLKAIELVKVPTNALEIGCEGGRWSKLLVDLGWKVVCTDINPNTLAICQERIPSAKCILVNAIDTTLPCDTSSQALLLCIEVISVLWNNWFINECDRVLSPGGYIIGVFENRMSLRGFVRHLISEVNGQFDYYKVGYPTWRRKLRLSGFNMVYEEGICWFPFSRSSNSFLVPAFTQIELLLGLRRLPSISPWIVFLAQKGN